MTTSVSFNATNTTGQARARVQDFASSLQACGSLQATWQTICEAYAANGIEHVIYMFMRPDAPYDNPLILANLPDWWVDYYHEEARAKDDPFFKTCGSFTPLRTGPEFVEENAHILTDSEMEFVRNAGETGLMSGVSSPVRLRNPGHYGGWNFGTGMRAAEFEKYIDSYWERLQLMGFIAHEALQRLAKPQHKESGGRLLSARERECLLWLACGLRTADIADRLGLANVTVELHFKRIRAKLGAATREEALAKAILTGEIVP